MYNVGIDSNAQLALVKLLVDLKLIPNVLSLYRQTGWTISCCPIQHFQSNGQIQHKDPLGRVAAHLGLKLVSLAGEQGRKSLKIIEEQVPVKFQREVWLQLFSVPLDASHGRILLGMVNPFADDVVRRVKFVSGWQVEIALVSEDELTELLKRGIPLTDKSKLFQPPPPAEDERPVEFRSTARSSSGGTQVSDPAASSKAVSLVNKLLADAIRADASDMHFSPGPEGLHVRIRQDGVMRELGVVPAGEQAHVVSRIKLLAGMDIAERHRPQDGGVRVKCGLSHRDLRISSAPALFGENVVIRILKGDLLRQQFSSLGLNDRQEDMMQHALKGSGGMLLVTGPTGSGKTTTLYTALQELNDSTNSIITIEDPIEYQVNGITQIQVNNKFGINFASGLRLALRQDPDVIMVGEIRDGETAQIAAQAAQTGHMVLSTIHTNSAAGAVSRMLDLGVPSYIMSVTLDNIIAQRLVRCLCPHCAVPLKGIDLEQYLPLGIKPENLKVSTGCEKCGGTGYVGRKGVFSLLKITDDVRDAIRRNAPEPEIEEMAREAGFQTLTEAAVELLNAGLTGLDEVERVLGELQVPSRPKMKRGNVVLFPNNEKLTKQRVLLVDDDPSLRKIIATRLNAEMFDVVEAGDGLQGLEEVYKFMPAIIVSDFYMPNMNGLELTRRLRNDPRTKDIPVLIMTSAHTEEIEFSSLDGGAGDFVRKGMDLKIMVTRVHKLLNQKVKAAAGTAT